MNASLEKELQDFISNYRYPSSNFDPKIFSIMEKMDSSEKFELMNQMVSKIKSSPYGIESTRVICLQGEIAYQHIPLLLKIIVDKRLNNNARGFVCDSLLLLKDGFQPYFPLMKEMLLQELAGEAFQSPRALNRSLPANSLGRLDFTAAPTYLVKLLSSCEAVDKESVNAIEKWYNLSKVLGKEWPGIPKMAQEALSRAQGRCTLKGEAVTSRNKPSWKFW
jgi:hypothetical protein